MAGAEGMRLRSGGGKLSGPKDALQRRSHPSLAARKFLTPERHGAGVSRTVVPAGTALASLLPRAWRGIVPCSLSCPTSGTALSKGWGEAFRAEEKGWSPPGPEDLVLAAPSSV